MLESPSAEPDTAPVRVVRRDTEHGTAILAAAHRLVAEKGDDFTTQELIKEAGVALRTFYRYYPSKDQLLLAVIEDLITGHCRGLAEAAREYAGPLERLHFYITTTVGAVAIVDVEGPRFLTSQHWRLQQQHPTEIAAATQPFTDLILSVLFEGRATGEVRSRNPERDAWLITKTVMAVFHYYAFASDDPTAAAAAEDVWQFCLGAVGGIPEP